MQEMWERAKEALVKEIRKAKRFEGEVVRYADYSAFGHFGRFMAPWEEMKKLEVW